MSETKIDPKQFRSALGAFLTGVTVVTTRDAQATPRGFTANSFTSVSLDPPLVLVCLAKNSSSFPAFQSCDRFAVNVLAENQKDISSNFASKIPDRFAQVAWREGALGCPLIEGASSWFECRTHELIDAGDHIVLMGRVMSFGGSDTMPLGYCRGTYVNLGLSQAAIAGAAHHRARVGAILESNGIVLLVSDNDGRLRLPSGSSMGPASDPGSLAAAFNRLGLTARLDFLFSVFEDHRTDGILSIYYRGALESDWPTRTDVHAIKLADMPWDKLADNNERIMLRRYVKERQEDAFAVYSGNTITADPLRVIRRAE
jgi:flavin reductase (DIM6/NTAB) family NADH-FMN oxidoreductase RutF